jgi:hypothetical protein
MGIRDAVAASDYVRASPAWLGGPTAHKEWQHFAVLAPDVDLLVNFSLCDDVRPGAPVGGETPRIVVLVRERDGRWDGDVETFARENAVVRRGDIDLRFGENRLLFGDTFEIAVALRERPIQMELSLRPLTQPAFVPSIPMLDGPPLNWVVVPRLEVHGTLVVGGTTYALDEAPAYHDHNWGQFLWGHDVAWEWGFVLPDDSSVPWSVTFVRLTDRRRTTALAHKVLVWKRDELARIFREHEVAGQTALGHLRMASVFKIPRPLALAAPGTATDVPTRFDTRAAAGDDRLECRCVPHDVAQVLIPSETELGVTIFNEVSARTRVSGRIRGESIEFAGRSVMEFIRYA